MSFDVSSSSRFAYPEVFQSHKGENSLTLSRKTGVRRKRAWRVACETSKTEEGRNTRSASISSPLRFLSPPPSSPLLVSFLESGAHLSRLSSS